jgi:diaminopimelate epimerase
MRLTKHHGLGNDFLVLLDLEGIRPVNADIARAVCDRHTGIGADGLIRVTRATGDADLAMQLFNADGGRAEMSGNGVRCLGQAVVQAGVVAPPTVRVMTDGGVRLLTIEPTRDTRTHVVSVDMGPIKVADDEPEWLDLHDGVIRAARADIGNPHLVLHVADPGDGPPLVAVGREVNGMVAGGINVELISPGPGPDEITMTVYERGVGPTLACGTGACAAAAVAHGWELVGDRATVHMPGGSVDVLLGDTVTLRGPTVSIAAIDWPNP